MKSLLILIVLIFSNISVASERTQLNTIAAQFKNRGWKYHNVVFQRHAHLVNYGNTDILSGAVDSLDEFIADFSEFTDEQLAAFYPEASIGTQSERVVVREKLLTERGYYSVLMDWPILLLTLETERWEDPDPSTCSASQNKMIEACGRKTRGDFVISSLTYNQRRELPALKEVALSELDTIAKSDLKLPVGPGLARLFQILPDSRSIDKLIQTNYVTIEDPNNSDLRKINIIEIARALIVQVFQDQQGNILNSDLVEIVLEKNACIGELDEVDCQLQYIKDLVWDVDFNSEEIVTNLILDPKGPGVLAEALITKFSKENPEAVTRAQLLNFLERAYFSIILAYDLNPLDPAVGPVFREQFTFHLKAGIEYLINRRNIIGLQMARGLQELIRFVEAAP